MTHNATFLTGNAFNSSDLRRYVYEQIRRMLRIGWVIQDEKRQKQGQIYHWLSIPANLQVELIENGYERSANACRNMWAQACSSISAAFLRM